jgi:hypothetical protein
MAHTFTRQDEIRKAFWILHGRNFPRGKNRNGEYHVDARMAFIDWIDVLNKEGCISDALAARVTL